MVKKGTVSYDRSAETLFIALEDYEYCYGVAEDGPDEVFADGLMLDKDGTTKIVAVEIFDLDGFDANNLKELTEEQRHQVELVYKNVVRH